MQPYVCVHAHFYQPPRENPWLDEVEVQDSATPYHDWNERITIECYAPNANSRILDSEGLIDHMVNNYARISFNFGATLLTWMERHAPETYSQILDADMQSRGRFSGHGCAIAQAYNHLIMPLANARDKRTQVIWGIRDFESRFNRKPEGMWLPETAADTPSLEALAEQGIAYTILAPAQARRVRSLDQAEWRHVDEHSLDTTRPYLVKLPSGRSISVFFYDGDLSHAVAFERVLADGSEFARRLVDASGQGETPRLNHIATDGETYGHHHRFGDMALSFALEHIAITQEARLTNYGEFLASFPPAMEAEIHEETSWSCAHGIERWRSDCGCNTGAHPDWNQAWRTPLRQSLDWLRDRLVDRFEIAAPSLLKDPWAARDDYIDVVLDRSPASQDQFFEKHAVGKLNDAERARVLQLLEMQRQAMLMFASCAWFFDEVTGIETVQALRHAARAMQLAQQLAPPVAAPGDEEFNELSINLEDEFLDRLADARSNLRDLGDGANAYRRLVQPNKLTLRKIAGHYAVSSLFHDYDDEEWVGAYLVQRDDFSVSQGGRARLGVGRLSVSSEVTQERESFYFAVVHMGDQNVTGGVGLLGDGKAYEQLSQEAEDVFMRGDFSALVVKLVEHFEGDSLALHSLLPDEQRRVVRRILEPVLDDAERSYRSIYEGNLPLMRYLSSFGFPMPNRLQMAAQVSLNLELRRALNRDVIDGDQVRAVIKAARLAGVDVDPRVGVDFTNSLERMAALYAVNPEDQEALRALVKAVNLLPDMPFEVELNGVQNIFYTTVRQVLARGRAGDTRALLLADNLVDLGKRLGVRVKVGAAV